MRIACSNCNAVYELPPARLRPGTGVRCARCKTVWVPVERVDAEPEIRPAPEVRFAVPEPAEEPVAVAAPAVAPVVPTAPVVAVPEAMPEMAPVATAPVVVPPAEAAGPVGATEAPGPRPSRLPLLAWVLSVLLLGGAAAAAVAYRDAVIAAWPASERAYRLLGAR